MKEIARIVLDGHLTHIFKENSLGNVLDLGGKHSPYKKEMRYATYLCLDINPNNKPDIVGDAHNLSMIKKETFDTVVATELLEHCHDPKQVLKEIHRVLKKSGKVIISTPFLYPYHPDPKDYFRYTRDGLKELCKEFSHVDVHEIGNRFFFIWEMITWKIHFLKLFNRIFYFIGNYKDKNGPTTYVTIAIK